MNLSLEGKALVVIFISSVLAIVTMFVLFLMNQRDTVANAYGVLVVVLTAYFLAKFLRRISKEGVVT